MIGVVFCVLTLFVSFDSIITHLASLVATPTMTELLTADPPAGQFSTDGGTSAHQLINATDQRLAIKIKCSDNALYRVNPVYAIAEPGQPLALEVTRNAGPAKDDRLVVQYMAVPADLVNVHEAFVASVATGAVFPELAIPLTAA